MSEEPEERDLDQERERVQEARVLEQLDEDEKLAQLRGLLATEEGRDVFWRILLHCGVYRSTYNRNFGDMALAEGQRNVGLWLLNEICQADPQAEMKMRAKAVALEHQEKAAKRVRPRRPS